MYADTYLVALLDYWHLCRDKLIKSDNNLLYVYVFIFCVVLLAHGHPCMRGKNENPKVMYVSICICMFVCMFV